MSRSVVYVGLDVHRDTVTMAVWSSHGSEPEWVKTYPNEDTKIRKAFVRLLKEHDVRACYEAGGCGFVLYRKLVNWGVHCDVIAPGLIPVRTGDRRKTDRRDATNLGRLYRSGELTPIHVPTEAQESVRDLVRCRDALRKDMNRSRHRVLKFLRRQGIVYREGTCHWGDAHCKWLRRIRLEPLNQELLDEYLAHLDYVTSRVDALARRIEEIAFSESYIDQVQTLRAFRGVDTLTAMTLLTELGDVRRFERPTQMMSYLGLTPSERSSGAKERRGPITKAGSARCRHVLMQAAWQYRHPPRLAIELRKRQENAPSWLVELSWKAQHRLNKRYHRLSYRKPSQVAAVAVARELVGFLWAALTENGARTTKSPTVQAPPELAPPTRTFRLEPAHCAAN